jgi:hypothetical protein
MGFLRLDREGMMSAIRCGPVDMIGRSVLLRSGSVVATV